MLKPPLSRDRCGRAGAALACCCAPLHAGRLLLVIYILIYARALHESHKFLRTPKATHVACDLDECIKKPTDLIT